ncbi:MAG: GNAT family N-acetyltransferase [Bradyrhizobium sp.]|nr:GNAT family N-acetyltransferase [Bradyrhizobium sp.]
MPTIRRANPDDAGFIAETILLAQRGHVPRGWFDIALNRPEPETIAFVRTIATARAQSWWHVAHFLVAEVEGVPAAALCALPARETVADARAAIAETAEATGLTISELAAIRGRGAYLTNCWVQGGESDWLVEHVASRPSYRGRGLILALIEHALAAGKAGGYAQASITFLIGNEVAQRCYSRAGFAFAEEKRDASFEALTGAPGFRRFQRAI